MPKSNDIHKILIIGSGPIVIGQAAEFDYAGTQACLSLQEDGYEVVLINSNPATIMTDPKIADTIYIEPITKEFVTKIIEKEKPCAILPTMGGQTALNVTMDLAKSGVLTKHEVKLLGTSIKSIELAENRAHFKQVIQDLGLDLPKSGIAKNLEEAKKVMKEIGLPLIIRPSFILGGAGSGIAHTEEELLLLCKQIFSKSPNEEIVFDEALIGYKEFEMEVVRDQQDNCIIVCCIENIDPLGIHTGDSITVAPALTLTDKEYQKMRNASFDIIRAIGVETGGSNVQFAIHPHNGRMVVIEMNPRVSRSSALASKATGFPIAKVATKLATGYTLPELSSDLLGNQIPASFEPVLDYVVIKIPRFNFEKFKSNISLGTQMHSVGEAMSIGRTFQEALLKGMRSLEVASFPIYSTIDDVKTHVKKPGPFRLWAVFDAFRLGMSLTEINQLTKIDPWFLYQIEDLVKIEQLIQKSNLNKSDLYEFKNSGFSDAQIGSILGLSAENIREKRKKFKIHPVFKRVDSCAAEFNTPINYLYSTYENECEANPSNRKKIIILGSGPSRIGQGIEFDYSCVHAIQALKDAGYETIMINCNPETVSTDYDCTDKLYLAPLTSEDVLDIIDKEQPCGVIVQYGGQTPLNLTNTLTKHNVPLLGMTSEIIEKTENRHKFKHLLQSLGLKQPESISISSLDEGIEAAKKIGYPLIVRPSFVLGGRAMSTIFHSQELEYYLQEAFLVSAKHPVLLEKFLTDAKEVDIDAICDGTYVFIPGILEHIEFAGIHSGDSACSLPPFSLSSSIQNELLLQTKKLALGLNFIGLINIQFAIKDNEVFVIEVNPRASRTAPFTSKATGIDLVQITTKCLLGSSLKEQGYLEPPKLKYFAVKEAVFPFLKFKDSDSLLGPEMKSTGEVLGFGNSFLEAYAKAQIASGYPMTKPNAAVIFSHGKMSDKWAILFAKKLLKSYSKLYAPKKTLALLLENNIPCTKLEQAFDQKIQFIVCLDEEDNYLRRHAINHQICHATTENAANFLLDAMLSEKEYDVNSLDQMIKRIALC